MPVEDPQPDWVGPTPHPASLPVAARMPNRTIYRGSHPAHSHRMPRAGSIQRIVILGDSISDEYRFYAPDRVRARNWVEILAATRGLFFGNPSITSDASRDRRFAYNWSQSGATTSSLIAAGQHSSLAAQVSRGAPINLVAVTVGTNDFADVLIKSKSVSAMDDVVRRARSNLVAILDAMFQVDSGLKVAAFTAVDLRCSPLLRWAFQLGLISPARGASRSQPLFPVFGRSVIYRTVANSQSESGCNISARRKHGRDFLTRERGLQYHLTLAPRKSAKESPVA